MDSITITTGTYKKIDKLLSLVGKTSEGGGKTRLTLDATREKGNVLASVYVPKTADNNSIYMEVPITENGNSASGEYAGIEVDAKDFTHQINQGLAQNPTCQTITLEKPEQGGKILARFTPNNGEIPGKYINPPHTNERNSETITDLLSTPTPPTHSVTLTPTEVRTLGQAATIANGAYEHKPTEIYGVYLKLTQKERVYGATDEYKAIKHTCLTDTDFKGKSMSGNIRIPHGAVRAAEALTPGRGKELYPTVLHLNAGDNTGSFEAPNGTVYFTFSTLQGEPKARSVEEIIFEKTRTDMGWETIDIDGDTLNEFVADVKKKTRSTKRVYVTITPDYSNNNKDTVTLSADYYGYKEDPRNLLTRTITTAPRDPDLYVGHASVALSQLIASLNALAPTKGTKLGVVSLEMPNQAHSKTVLLSHAVLEGEKPVVDSAVVVGTAYLPYTR
jgi:hypothetical protein